jgi:hypothetical protein
MNNLTRYIYEILTNEGLKEDLRNKNIERALFQLEKTATWNTYGN